MISFISQNFETIFTVIGSIISVIFGFLAFIIRFAYNKHTKQMDDIRKDVSTVGKMLSIRNEELKNVKHSLENVKENISNLSGSVKLQQETLSQYIERMGVMSGKLDAVFRFIDAPQRATDFIERKKL